MSEWSKLNADQQDYPVMLLESAARESEATGRNMLEGKSPYAELHLERARGIRIAIGVLEAARVGRAAPGAEAGETGEAVAPADAEGQPGRETVPEVKALPVQAGEGDQALGADSLVVGSREVGPNGRTKWQHGDHVRNRRTAEHGTVTLLQKSRAHFEEPDLFWMGNKGPFKVKDFYRPGHD